MRKPFEGLLGNNCELRMLEYLLPLEGIEFGITELAEEICVSKVIATRVVKKYVDWGVLKLVRTIDNTSYYGINHGSLIVKSIEQLNNILIENIIGDETLYEIHDYWKYQRSQMNHLKVDKNRRCEMNRESKRTALFDKEDIKSVLIDHMNEEGVVIPEGEALESLVNDFTEFLRDNLPDWLGAQYNNYRDNQEQL